MLATSQCGLQIRDDQINSVFLLLGQLLLSCIFKKNRSNNYPLQRVNYVVIPKRNYQAVKVSTLVVAVLTCRFFAVLVESVAALIAVVAVRQVAGDPP